MAEETKPSTPSTGSGLDPKLASVLAYFFGFLGGLIFFLIEKENKSVRFHAVQSMLLSVAFFVIWFAMIMFTFILAAATAGIGALFGLLMPFIGLGALILWIVLMVKAYNGEEWELPIIGKIAREQANK